MTAPLLPADVQRAEDQAFGEAFRRAVAAMPFGWSGPAFAFGPRVKAAVAPPQTAMSFILFETPIEREGPDATAALTALAEALEARAAE